VPAGVVTSLASPRLSRFFVPGTRIWVPVSHMDRPDHRRAHQGCQSVSHLNANWHCPTSDAITAQTVDVAAMKTVAAVPISGAE